jgi:hypothetical protein
MEEIKGFFHNYEDVINEIREKVVPQIFKKDLLPGYTRPTLAQIDKHIMKLIRNKVTEETATLLTAYGIILGETIIKNVEGAKWLYEAPNIQMVRVQITEGEDPISALPIYRVVNLFKTKDRSKSIASYYDSVIREFQNAAS